MLMEKVAKMDATTITAGIVVLKVNATSNCSMLI